MIPYLIQKLKIITVVYKASLDLPDSSIYYPANFPLVNQSPTLTFLIL